MLMSLKKRILKVVIIFCNINESISMENSGSTEGLGWLYNLFGNLSDDFKRKELSDTYIFNIWWKPHNHER